MSLKVFEISSNIEFNGNMSSESRVTSCGRREVAKLTVAFSILRTRPKKKVIRRNPRQILESFSFTRELLCCFISERKILPWVREKAFSTLTFKINSSGKQDKQECKPFNCLFEAFRTSQPGVTCYVTVTAIYILQEFHEFYVIMQLFSSSVLRHVEH